MLLRLRHAKMPQVSTKMAYKVDQQYDCHWVGSIGSKAMGYANKASMDPKLDNANKR